MVFVSPLTQLARLSHNWRNSLKFVLFASFLSLTACQDKTKSQPSTPSETTTASTATPPPSNSAIIIASSPKETQQPFASNTASTSINQNLIQILTSLEKSSLEPFLQEFSQKTGISVNIIQSEPMSILARLQAEGDNSPIDMILTEDVGVFHQGVEHNLLQPFNLQKDIQHAPARFLDPNAYWLALSQYGRLAVFNSKNISQKDISSFADLAKQKWYQKLCLTQRSYIANQSFVVDLLNQLGEKKTKEVLQNYQRNLSMPVLLNDKEIFKAIESGKCQIGLVSSHNFVQYQQDNPKTMLQSAWINTGYGGVHTNVLAVGIPRSAQQPALSLQLIEWILDKEQIGLFASISHTFPLSEQVETSALLKSLEKFRPSSISLSEYGEKQKTALELMQEAGYQ